jgi:ribosomal protein S18 acetylase RimI-like enzyme
MASTLLWQHYNITKDSAARRLGSGLGNGATIAVADLSGESVGFVWYVERGAFNRSGYILLIGVRPDLHGHGIGQALMEHAESVLRAARSPDVFCSSRISTMPRKSFMGGWAINKLVRFRTRLRPASPS